MCLPIIVIIIFGFLAYRNVQQIAYRTVPLVRRELDKQLTTMVLLEVFSDLLFILPYFIFNSYSATINPPSGSILASELALIFNVVTIFYYWRFVVCPLFLFSSNYKKQYFILF